MVKKTHKYQLTITFESEKPLRVIDNGLIQFDNGLDHFVNGEMGSNFVPGTGIAKLKKLGVLNIKAIIKTAEAIGIADSGKTLQKHVIALSRELRRLGYEFEASEIKKWTSQDLLDLRVEYGF